MHNLLYGHRNALHYLVHNATEYYFPLSSKRDTTERKTVVNKSRRQRLVERNANAAARAEMAAVQREKGFNPTKRPACLLPRSSSEVPDKSKRNKKVLPTLAREVKKVSRFLELRSFLRDSDNDDDNNRVSMSEDDPYDCDCDCDRDCDCDTHPYYCGCDTDPYDCAIQSEVAPDLVDDDSANSNCVSTRAAESTSQIQSQELESDLESGSESGSVSSVTTSEDESHHVQRSAAAVLERSRAEERPVSPSASVASSSWDVVSMASSLGSDWELVSPALPSSHSIAGDDDDREDEEEERTERGQEGQEVEMMIDDEGNNILESERESAADAETSAGLLPSILLEDNQQVFNDDFLRPQNPSKPSYAQVVLQTNRVRPSLQPRKPLNAACPSGDSERGRCRSTTQRVSTNQRVTSSHQPFLHERVIDDDEEYYELSTLSFHDLDGERDKERDRKYGKMNRSRAGKTPRKARKHAGHDGSGMSRVAKKMSLTVIG